MAIDGVIRPLHCYGNAYVVANYLIENGYEKVRVVDGLYRDLKDAGRFTSTHRFIQYTNTEGLTRYYDPTLEVIPTMSQTWRWEYKALRIFDLNEIARYEELSAIDEEAFRRLEDMPPDEALSGCGSTLNRNIYDNNKGIYLLPYINDSGEFVGRVAQREAVNNYCKEALGAA